jgi:exonuclease VII small subunit
MKLSRYCAGQLDETERKISLIMEKADGGVTEEPFDDTEE